MTARPRHPLVLVAAVARNGIIGAAGTMPWRLPGDLAHFRATTLGHPLLMGRATFAAIGRPLPGRPTTVLSRTTARLDLDAAVAADLPTALASADRHADALGAAAIMVVGGGTVYAATIGLARTLLITDVDATPDGDVAFPPIDPDVWWRAEARDAPPQPGDSCRYRFVRWERRAIP